MGRDGQAGGNVGEEKGQGTLTGQQESLPIV